MGEVRSFRSRVIKKYFEEHRPEFAEGTVLALEQAVDSLQTMPRRGRIGRRPGTRELVLVPLPYVVVYQVTDSGVRVVRLLHTSRDWR